ncbi:hypothetical protein EAH81_19915 [Flavobacterium pectinovorum]|uniref:Uncharacterized protein n=1 Tax=Flavobacterium pectinovorum TaxID=29533 RepID=A0A502EJ35_9FLAO|nr:hypothetical protein EAH81_19915 [Flavobacterium pectinovorum]
MKTFLNFSRKLISFIWLLLTVIVIFFLIQQFTNPGIKGISNYDLKLYLKFTLCFAFIFISLKFFASKLKSS